MTEAPRRIRRWLVRWLSDEKPAARGAGEEAPDWQRLQKASRSYRQLFDRIAGVSPEIVYVYDTETERFSYVNDAVEATLGHTVAEVTGQGAEFMRERLHTADRESFAQHQRRVGELLDSEVAEVELRLQHIDGGWRWLRLRNRVLSRTSGGDIRELLGTATDITEHTRAQEALRLSEERYRIVSDLTSDYAFSVRVGADGALQCEWITEAFGRITGYEPEDLSERMWEQFVHPDDHATRRVQFQRAILSGRLIHEYRIIRKSGEVRWIREHARVIRNQDGSLHWYGACQDITEWKLAEEARCLSQERFNAITQSSRDIIAEFDASARMLYVSPNVLELTGIDPETILSHPREEVLHPDDARMVGERLTKAMNSGESESLMFRMHHSDGEWHWMDTTVTAFHTADGEVRAVMISRDITDRLKIEDERRRLVSVVENSSEFIAMMKPDGQLLFLNDAGHAMIDVQGKLRAGSITIFDCLSADDAQDLRFQVLPAVARDGHWEGDFRLRHLKTGARIATLAHVFQVSKPPRGGAAMLAIVARDISERITAENLLRQSQEQLLQSQKMEAIGRLAGGVAHDFNNLLTAITGYGDLLLEEIGDGKSLRSDVEEILRAAERAAGLTSQLLAFSRRQVLLPKVLDLNALVSDVERLLRRLIGENIELTTRFDGHRPFVRLDPGQLEQLVINLCVNARDAMPQGGRLTIATSNLVVPDEGDPRHPGIAASRYVVLTVRDTGVGMTPETISKIFEPFFTTKDATKGTGLGLATVYGIIRQSGGEIRVDSEPGAGSTFTVYLPQVDETPAEKQAPATVPVLWGDETVLLVEDSDTVRRLVKRTLERHGYTVIEASCGLDALRIAREHDQEIALLLTDVVLPKMDGHELAQSLRERRPELQVIYMSGFSGDALAQHGVDAADIVLIQKPFAPAELLREVRRMLDRTRGGHRRDDAG